MMMAIVEKRQEGEKYNELYSGFMREMYLKFLLGNLEDCEKNAKICSRDGI